MIAIPADAAAHVEQDFRHELEGAEIFRRCFRWGGNGRHRGRAGFFGYGVAEIEFVRAGDVAFGADAEEFRLDGVEVEFAGDSGFLKMASRDSARSARGALRSTGMSLEPSGIQTFVTQGLPRRCRCLRRFRGSVCSARSRIRGCPRRDG